MDEGLFRRITELLKEGEGSSNRSGLDLVAPWIEYIQALSIFSSELLYLGLTPLAHRHLQHPERRFHSTNGVPRIFASLAL